MIYVINKFQPNPYPGLEIDTTSRGNNKDLSPFYLGPVPTYEPGVTATNVENLWQYSKVYKEHAYAPKSFESLNDPMAYEPSPLYYDFRDVGWKTQRAVRYPMGKGAKPLYSFWKGTKLSYVEARKKIYIPAYASAVVRTESYRMLFDTIMNTPNEPNIILRDFDGYDYIKMGMTLKEVANNPKKSMGHGFVLAMLLTGEIYKCMEM
jgi:hypothetical protein